MVEDYVIVDGEKIEIMKEFEDPDSKKILENALMLPNFHIKDILEIEGLKNLANLQMMDLGGNQITKLRGLENLTHLKWLSLKQNKIQEIEFK